VVVGAASRDLAANDPRGWRLGGAATYCSLTAARLGLRVGCLLGVDREAFEAAESELGLLEAAGVQLSLARLEAGPVFENLERGGHRRQRWLSRSDRIGPGLLPEAWRDAPAWLLVPVAGELGPEWAGAVPRGSRLGLSWQGLLRDFAPNGWVEPIPPDRSALLEVAGLVVASVDDLPAGARLSELLALTREAAIVLTAGQGGGVALRKGSLVRYRAEPASEVVDPTGAGDVFLAALMAAWLLTGELASSATLRFAAAAGSCAVEGLGLAGVPTPGGVAARLRDRGPARPR
jgi:sugar/nucleoside kinase (ribokinase family)